MYSAQDVADILKKYNREISKRTVNYYAFDRKMFETESKKNCFTDEDVEKIENILLLREKTSYTLEQIKTIINTKTSEEIRAMFSKEDLIERIFEEISPHINSTYQMSEKLSNELCSMNLNEKTKKIIGGFKK